MSDWIDFSNGLPQNIICKDGGIIFYRDNKLRIAGNRGIWESPLYSAGTPVAQPMADRQLIASRDTVSFTDYSNLIYSGAKWEWSFPGASYVSSTTMREPKVLYASPGSYPVTLKVTDASGNTHSRTIEHMITVSAAIIGIDAVAGKCLRTDSSRTAIGLGKVNIKSNNFSISCWIKPDGLQKSFGQFIAQSAGPSEIGLGFAFNGYTPNLNLTYTGPNGWASGLIADSTAWNFVVLTYSPAGVTIYLNGVPASRTAAMPVRCTRYKNTRLPKTNY